MAVYTEVSRDEAAILLARLGLGELTAFEPCVGGIENTNYFIDAGGGRYVLTLFERLNDAQLPYYLRLMLHLAQHGLPAPLPHADAAGEILHTLRGKPAALVDRLPGRHHLAPDAGHCSSLGTFLARMHLAAASFALQQPHLRGLAWCIETLPQVAPLVTAEQRELLTGELAFQQHLAASGAYAQLPRGPIHADLFRDNAMFEGERLTGVVDFYFAGTEVLLFDLAVCLNDWCIDLASGMLVTDRAEALMRAYSAVRPLSGNELRLLPGLMRAAAFRFWLSRLWDWYLPRPAHVLEPHDPEHFERVLRTRIAQPWHPGLGLAA
jgi:homoserine kinase type II